MKPSQSLSCGSKCSPDTAANLKANVQRQEDGQDHHSSTFRELRYPLDLQYLGGSKEMVKNRVLAEEVDIVDDPEYQRSLNIFMLMNRNNDGYI